MKNTEDPVTTLLLAWVAREMRRQDEKFGDQTHHPDHTGTDVDKANLSDARSLVSLLEGTSRFGWKYILFEEVYEAFAESDPARLSEELIQVAAVCCQWAKALGERRA